MTTPAPQHEFASVNSSCCGKPLRRRAGSGSDPYACTECGTRHEPWNERAGKIATAHTTAILNAAADIMADGGLNKGMYWPDYPAPFTPGQPCCVYGALSLAMKCSILAAVQSPAAAQLAIHVAFTTGSDSLLAWNDWPAATAADIITTIRDCANQDAAARRNDT